MTIIDGHVLRILAGATPPTSPPHHGDCDRILVSTLLWAQVLVDAARAALPEPHDRPGQQ